MSNGYEILRLLDGANVPGRNIVDRVRVLISDRDKLWDEVHAARTRTDREALVASLDEDRWQTLGVLADCCIDAGLHDEARGWGWLAAAKKWPVWSGHHWTWLDAPGHPHLRDFGCVLPIGLCRAASGRERLYFKTQGEALWAVVDAIASGRWKEEGGA